MGGINKVIKWIVVGPSGVRGARAGQPQLVLVTGGKNSSSPSRLPPGRAGLEASGRAGLEAPPLRGKKILSF